MRKILAIDKRLRTIPLYAKCLMAVAFSVVSLCRISAGDIKTDFYDRWALMPTKALLDKGTEFMNRQGKVDSATVCFTVIVNRCYKKQAVDDEAKYYIAAMSRLGYIYQYQYFDYSKAYTYLQQALSLSEESGISGGLPSIYLR